MPSAQWLHQFPHGEPRWDNCQFIFDQRARDYDWLVVYDDIPERPGDSRGNAHEELACSSEHTLLVTTEPSSIKIYGNDYTRQFGAVLTSQAAWALPHRQRIYSQPGLHWFYGIGSQYVTPFDAMLALADNKSKILSMVYSSKSMRHTLHHRRASFMRELMQQLPDLDVFGRGALHTLDDKADCLRDYRYHVAIENFIGEHHWTEKLADAFLGESLPFYAGCPNVARYFPADSFIAIDMRDVPGSVATIRKAIKENAYEARLPAIREAKRRVLYEYNLFAVLAREIAARYQPNANPPPQTRILSRRAVRTSSPAIALRDFYGKVRARVRHWPDAF
ncbi:MAG: glycosyltransferase family 10 domain-containing protein [Thiobacillus sp.]